MSETMMPDAATRLDRVHERLGDKESEVRTLREVRNGLIRRCYAGGESAQHLADRLGLTVRGVYKVLEDDRDE